MTSLADELWLAAHDGVNGKARLGPWALGVGLGTALLAELVYNGYVQLCDGDFFRTRHDLSDDPALRTLLRKMQTEELSWAPAELPGRAPARPHEGFTWPADGSHGRHGHALAADRSAQFPYPPVSPDESSRPEETWNRRRGHRHAEWLSYLAYQGRAETLVVDRLARVGLARPKQERRLLRAPTTTFVPHDSVASGTPANRLSIALQGRERLGRSQLCLAALILATGLHHHAFATLNPADRSYLSDELQRGLDEPSRELLRAADAAVGEAAMR
ncbi:GPP34 family phosphoprotein [Paractinoplanes brasiliensis]|uniref:Golgi phosphoprotein 3 GPP34 n=1 Tax=Paractinoplanes brasiliensis TaxID=52695 RepID=A0A4R6JW75_9ACTN|nr:GPP34 family phosphoprotein [Actinoplanes brasiliensis]TDO38945.1 Golgi phosphoprotein 3 GPP34 [Actinoplanes brasiliensis]GID33447.1 hypothetical protein Abr02nite_84300 [Actinoplanes brasiliensis]